METPWKRKATSYASILGEKKINICMDNSIQDDPTLVIKDHTLTLVGFVKGFALLQAYDLCV